MKKVTGERMALENPPHNRLLISIHNGQSTANQLTTCAYRAGKELGSRRRNDDEDVVDVEGQVVEATVLSSSASGASNSGSRGKGGKGEKFRALKAREAASKAASAE